MFASQKHNSLAVFSVGQHLPPRVLTLGHRALNNCPCFHFTRGMKAFMGLFEVEISVESEVAPLTKLSQEQGVRWLSLSSQPASHPQATPLY